jgi:glycosyltransferase involved in cell wall biosynthesis
MIKSIVSLSGTIGKRNQRDDSYAILSCHDRFRSGIDTGFFGLPEKWDLETTDTSHQVGLDAPGRQTTWRIGVVQRVIFHYRVGLFSRMARKWDTMVFHGNSVPKSKVVNAPAPYPFPTRILFTISKRAKKNAQQILFFNPGCVISLMRWKPDILLLEGSNNILNNIAIYIYCKLFSKPYIWWGIGQVPGRKDSIYRKLLTPARRFIIRRAAYCLAYSQYSADYFKTITTASRVKVLPNSIDNESVEKEIADIPSHGQHHLRKSLGIHNNAVVLLFVGALEPNKRLDIFIKALKILSDGGYEVEGFIVGSGVAESNYRALANRLNVKNCHFLGKIVEGVNIYFQVADIFILPGRGGLAINQALINGLPVICNTPADGTERDMIESGTNGVLIESMTVQKLVSAVRDLIHSNRYIEMGRQAKRVIHNRYNMNIMLDVLEETFRNTAKKIAE